MPVGTEPRGEGADEGRETQRPDSDFLRAASGAGEAAAGGAASALEAVSGLLSGLAGAFGSVVQGSPSSRDSSLEEDEHRSDPDQPGSEPLEREGHRGGA